MTFITTDDLQSYQNKYIGDDEEALKLVQRYCDAGMEAVKDYLHYNPESTELTTEKEGADSLYFPLDAAPVTEITEAYADGEEIDVTTFRIGEDNLIAFANRSKFSSDVTYKFVYKAGFEKVPEKIKTCALQIASLYWESAGGNLAVSSTSFADTGSRVFNNFTADRFLSSISSYRILRF